MHKQDTNNDDEHQSLLKKQQVESYTDEKSEHYADNVASLLDAHDNHQKDIKDQSKFGQTKSPWDQWIPMLMYWPIGRITALGRKKIITDTDLDNLSDDDKCSTLSKRLSAEDWSISKTWLITLRVFWKDTFYVGFYSLLFFIARIAQPVLLREIILDISRPEGPQQTRADYIYAFLLFLSIIAHGLFRQQYFFRSAQVGMRVKNALSSMIYQHLLSLNQLSIQQTNAAQVINLIANDTTKFEEFWHYGNFIWIVPLESVLVFLLRWWIIGLIPTLISYTVLLIIIIIQTICSRGCGYVYHATSISIDKRIKMYSQLVYGRNTIKMYNWEKPMEEQVDKLRAEEMNNIQKGNYLRAISGALYFIAPSLMAAFVFGSIWLSGKPLIAANVFSALMFFNLIRLSVACFFPIALQRFSTMLVASKRIDAFMHLKRIDSEKEQSDVSTSEKDKNSNGSIIMQDASFSWGLNDTCLQSLNINIKAGELVGVVGQVGSGKSSLLAAILGEMNQTRGKRHVSGTISYASQLTCLFPDTIRANILLNKPMDGERYDRVLRACCLDIDLGIIGGADDMTMLGEHGVNISGGQKARLSLARALYRDADIYLLDDPLAAVDVNVAKNIYNSCIGPQGLLANKTRVLVTHQTHFLKESDQIILLANGHIEAQSSFDQLTLLHNFESQKHSTIAMDKKDGDTSAVSADELEADKPASDDKSIIGDEISGSGNVKWITWFRLFSAPPLGWFGFVFLIFILIVSEAVSDVSNLWLAVWIEQPFSVQQSERWLAYLYFILVLGVVICGFVYTFFWFYSLLQGANHFHNRMLKGILYTSTRFFENNPSGRILNRASRDQHIIDKLLPEVLFEAMQALIISIGASIIVIIINPWTLLLFVPLVFISAWLYRYYACTNYQLKRLESVSRSPIYTLFHHPSMA